ncbi:MAG: histidine phosphatase family protein [Acidobacteriota bacterium]|nr:MAG: histidine phosphatase family protein [Acidobacteriota bacterium]
MKKLLVLRHAKSSWDDDSLSDFERPLNDRGQRTALFMGKFIADNGLTPEVIVSSPAARARATTELVAEAMEYSGDAIFDPKIYEASANALVGVVSQIDEEYMTALLIGHNPGLEGLVYYLTDVFEPLQTAALAVIELDIENWGDVDSRTGKLSAIYRPRDLMK